MTKMKVRRKHYITDTSVPDLLVTPFLKGKRKRFPLEICAVNFILCPSPLLLQALPEAQSFHKGRDSRAETKARQHW